MAEDGVDADGFSLMAEWVGSWSAGADGFHDEGWDWFSDFWLSTLAITDTERKRLW